MPIPGERRPLYWGGGHGPWFNIKMPSYQYRKSHCGDKTILRPSYLHNGNSYTGKMPSLYWIGALTAHFPVVHTGSTTCRWRAGTLDPRGLAILCSLPVHEINVWSIENLFLRLEQNGLHFADHILMHRKQAILYSEKYFLKVFMWVLWNINQYWFRQCLGFIFPSFILSYHVFFMFLLVLRTRWPLCLVYYKMKWMVIFQTSTVVSLKIEGG